MTLSDAFSFFIDGVGMFPRHVLYACGRTLGLRDGYGKGFGRGDAGNLFLFYGPLHRDPLTWLSVNI